MTSGTRSQKGLAVLAGAGPGEPGLITVSAADWLARAQCVIYDRLANVALLNLAPQSAEMIYVGKSPQKHEMSQADINRLLVEKVAAGLLVVRLKGGDPLLFGRGGEEADALARAGLQFRIVPGVSAAFAAGAYAGIPLTDRRVGPSIAMVTGHEDPAKGASAVNFKALAAIDTVVFYMGVGNLRSIAKSLISAGKDPKTPAAVVQQASTPSQRTVTGTLANIASIARRRKISPPSVVIVGKVVSFRRRLNWFDRLPLLGQTVLVTRTRQQASALSKRLAELGAHVIESPTIEISPADTETRDSALARLGSFDWIVFTSPNGVEAVFDRLYALGRDARALAWIKVAAVGSGTAGALAQHGIKPDLVPAKFTTESLGEALGGTEVPRLAGKKILLARADIATDELPRILAKAGAGVEELVAYHTVLPPLLPPEAIEALRSGQVNWITFTSSSTVDNLFTLLALEGVKLPRSVKLACIGPVTAKALRLHRRRPTVVAEPYTIEALVEAMIAWRRKS